MKTKKIFDIGEVAKQSGLPVSTLRYYEEIQLIRSEGRCGLKRLFGLSIFEQLDFIALGCRAGFSLDEIRDMFTSNGHFKIDRKLLLAKAEKLNQQIKNLLAVRDCLEHVARCPVPSQMECPKFQKLLKVAGKSAAKFRRQNRQHSVVN